MQFGVAILELVRLARGPLAKAACLVLAVGTGAATAAAPIAATGGVPQVQRHIIIMGDGQQAGEQELTRTADGWVSVRYRFKDNGRGPELQERFRLAADGTLAEYQVTGTETLGSQVDEHFVRDGQQARWKSTTDRGETQIQGSAMYVPINGSPAMLGVQTAALARRGLQGNLPLLPSGRLTQRVLAELQLTRPAGVAGPARQKVQLLAQTGLGLTPVFLWVSPASTPERPEQVRLFASIEPGYSALVPQGWQGVIGQLTDHQLKASRALRQSVARQVREPLPGLTVLRRARVFDSETAQLSADSDVFVLRGRIAAVTPAGAIALRGDREIDAAGRVLLPGLFDMHGHYASEEGLLHLAAGVTTVRDMGNANATLQRNMDEIAAGDQVGPQIVPAGFLEGESPYASRGGFVISTREQAEMAVDWYASHGYPQLKIYNSFPQELLPGIVAYAHQRGLRVSGHVPVHLRAAQAVEAGYDELQHINQVLLNFLVTPETDTRTLDRFILPARDLADLDLDSAPVRDFVARLRQRHITVDPTLATFDFIKQRPGELSSPLAAVASHLPPDVQRGLRTGGLDMRDEATAKRYAASYAKMVEFVGRMYRAGIDLVAGTDNLPGLTLHAELALYVKAGLTPAQALQIATRNGARFTGTQAERGRIAPGYLADLVLVDGDPTRDIAELSKVALVITQGHLHRSAALYAQLGIQPFTDWKP